MFDCDRRIITHTSQGAKGGFQASESCQKMDTPKDPADNLNWFYEHCSSHHYLLETAMPMLDVAVFIIRHIKRLDISFVSNKVKADLVRLISDYTKAQGSKAHLYVYIEPIAIMLLAVMDDEYFQHDKFIELHSSIMATASAATPLVSGEQTTPLTSNLSDRQQNLLSPGAQPQPKLNSMGESQRQAQPQSFPGADPQPKLNSVRESQQQAEEVGDVGACDSYPGLLPVDLDQNFAAANVGINYPEKSRVDSSPEDEEYCVLIDQPLGQPLSTNRSLSKYSLSDAWTRENLSTFHSKFSGTSTSWHMFLQHELHCKQCSFPESVTTIFIGDQAYINKCTNTNVWLDADFLEGFATLLYHYSHSSSASSATDKDLPQLVHVSHPKQTLAAHNVKPIPSLVKRLVGILHNKQHCVVLEVLIAERLIRIFDGLSRDLLQWKDHIVTVFKKCMLLDLSFDASSAVFVPYATGPPPSSRSRKPKPIINVYSIRFPIPLASDNGNWRLERGQFIHQKDGFNCGPISCLKVMDLFGQISLPDPQVFYECTNICYIVMSKWEDLLKYCNTNLPLFYREKPVKGSMQDETTATDIVDDENGINFAPLCTSDCLGKHSVCVHQKKNVQINT